MKKVIILILTVSLTGCMSLYGTDTVGDTKITKKIDSYTGEITYRTPYRRDFSIETMSAVKVTEKGHGDTYYLSLSAYSYGIYDGEGVIILFSDGSKKEYGNTISYDIPTSGTMWTHSAFIDITSEIDFYLSHTIVGYKLYIIESPVQAKNYGVKFKTYLNQLKNAI